MHDSGKKILFKTILFFFSFSFSISILSSNSTAQEKTSLDTHIANSYVQATFGGTVEPKKSSQPQEQNFLQNLFKIPRLEKITFTEQEKHKIAFDITMINNQSLPTDVTIDKTFIDKMELVAGGQNSEEHLVSKIFEHMHTALGKSWCALNLTKPTTNVNLLQRRQKTIQLLLDNEQLLQDLDKSLAKLKEVEDQLLIFWHHQPLVNTELFKFVYFNRWLDKLNTCTTVLETSNKILPLLPPALGPAFNFFIFKKILGHSFWGASKETGRIYLNSFMSLTTLFQLKNDIPLVFRMTKSLTILLEGFSIYGYATQTQNKVNVGKYLQDTLIGTASYLHNAKNIKYIIKNNKELLQAIPALEHLIRLDDNEHHSAQFIKLLDMLKTNTFKGSPSMFSITGRILAAHKLMTIVKDELATTLNAIAELDTYVALAKLYKNQNSSAPYSFVEFKKNDAPYLQATNFWNPFVNPDIVVTNSVELGHNNAQNIVLTGPNTGGKSTIIKALLINILLAQTFGIASAEQFVMTPFKKINCYLNITDDIAAGVSLFKAEVLRAKELIDTLHKLPPHDFCFTIMDEVFSGTSPQEGESAAYKFSEQLGNFGNGIMIIATHYPKLIDLEQNGPNTYKNYHVEVVREENGSLNRTFKLLPEPSRMNIALDLLKEAGVL